MPNMSSDPAPQPPTGPPLALRDFGSFHVGGRMVGVAGMPERMIDTGNPAAPMPWNRNGRYLTDRMYVQYLLPAERRFDVPVVFLHGGGLSGLTLSPSCRQESWAATTPTLRS